MKKQIKASLLDLIDFEKVNTLLEGFNQSTGFVTAIIDMDGNILSKSGWRSICTAFHRNHPETSRRCIISDTVLAGKTEKGEKYHFYHCLNGLVDVAVPIVVKGEHIANLFSGQFFFEKPDEAYFRKQAETFGFPEEAYLKALAEVPVISEEKVKVIMGFLLNMTQLISDMTFQKLELLELNKSLQEGEETYRTLFESINDAVLISEVTEDGTLGRFIKVNDVACKRLGYSEAELLTKSVVDINSEAANESLQNRVLNLFEAKSSIFESEHVAKNGRIIPVEVSTLVTTFKGKTIIHSIVRDITERYKAATELRQSEDKFKKAFFTNPDAITITRISDGVYVSANVGFAQTFEYNVEDIIGKTALDITIWYEVKERDVFIQTLRDAGTVRNFETKFITRTGKVLTCTVFSTIIELEGVPHALTVTRDITERRLADQQLKEKTEKIASQNEEFHHINEELNKTNAELVAAKERAEESDRLKTAFLQNLSHEIRTPMNAIMGFAELLGENLDDKEKLDTYVKIINQRSSDLLGIINDVLDVAKIESGQWPVTVEPCDLKQLFAELHTFFNEYQIKQAKGHIAFDIRLDVDPLSSVILTDKMKLKQILINLIGNAFKFTEKGTVIAGCKPDVNQQWVFYVSDTGIGIPADKQQFIFERFAQLEQTPGHLYGGAGLGLSIVGGLVGLLKGAVWLESELGKGTTFYVAIPYVTE